MDNAVLQEAGVKPVAMGWRVAPVVGQTQAILVTRKIILVVIILK